MSEPTRAGDEPIGIEVEAGKDYWWCACGKSSTQPFCDGSHQGTEFSPLQYTAEESTTVWFCNCKQTKSQPMCDGSHSS